DCQRRFLSSSALVRNGRAPFLSRLRKRTLTMTVGIPGAGIGGLFYILNALWMPFREARLAIQGRSSPERWELVKRQATIAIGILASLGVTGWVLGLALATHLTRAAVADRDVSD